MHRNFYLATKILTAALATTAVVGDKAQAVGFRYSYSNPFNPNADDYIFSKSNVELLTEGTVRAWIPATGGADFSSTTPGVITYKFDFASETVESAFLRTNNPTFHWSYSQGHNFFYASKDGSNWVQLLDVTPPAFGGGNSGFYNTFLPDSLLGGSELWFKTELYSYGPAVNNCGVCSNTAQHSRWDTSHGGAAETFKLEVDFAKAAVVPAPAALPLLGTGVAIFGFFTRMRRRRS